MRVIACANLKGGVGKTTTAGCLAIGMARRLKKGRRALLIDGDAQSNLTHLFAQDGPVKGPTLADVLVQENDLGDAIAEAIRPSRVPGIDLLAADIRLADATMLLADSVGREARLRLALRTVEARYDLAILDTPPRLDLCCLNCLNASQEILVCVDAGVFAALGLGRLTDTVAKIRKLLDNDALRIIGLLLTRAMRNRSTAEIESQLRDHYGPLVYRSVIPYAEQVEIAHAHRRSVLEQFPKSKAAVAYDALVDEVWNHAKKPARHAHRKHGAA